jgi:hypothetical protein
MKQKEEKFEEYREHLILEANRLGSFIYLYRRLNERREDRLDEMNIAPCFFQIIFSALFSVIIIWTEKLFSCNSERGVINFLSFVENNINMFEISQLQKRKNYPNDHWMLNRDPITIETIKEDRKKIETLISLPNFKLRRDKFHAHFDKEYFFNRSALGNDAPIKHSDLDEIIELMKDILNRYSSAYDGNVYSLEYMNINDIDQLLNIVHKYRMEEIARYSQD